MMIRRPRWWFALGCCCVLIQPFGAAAQTDRSVLLPAGLTSPLPVVHPNDNEVPAGSDLDGARFLDLEVVEADWRLETSDRPGLRVAAVAEVGGAPSIPAPLLRVESGTTVRVRVRNGLDDRPIRIYGLHARPSEPVAPLVLTAGEGGTVEFVAGAPGTYLYWIEEGPEPSEDEPSGPQPEREQLAGAYVVDPPGGSPADRVMVMNIFSNPVDTAVAPTGFVEGLSINGRSWPFTERQRLEVGTPVRWRVVNASQRFHPMHLHGFYFDVLARGTPQHDTVYAEADRRLVVTEGMQGRTTMLMEWTPTRPGTWLFHCHLSFHVRPEIRLPGAEHADPEGEHVHMAGLVIGIEVAPGPSDLRWEGAPRQVELYALEYGDEAGYRYGFSRTPEPAADSLTDVPGPALIFNQYEAIDMRVENRMSHPTGVHWHGLEIDAWADGVPNWSASDGKMSPVIAPGTAFTYRLSLMRPGTFIYHSHLNDVDQLTGGLYGPLIVLPPGDSFDPRTDHVKVFGWKKPNPRSIRDVELNGSVEQPPATARVGERHRFRVINIGPAGQIAAWVLEGDERQPIRLLARDGADLPEHQQVETDALLPRLGAGSTADFTWTPTEPGTYVLRIGPQPTGPAGFVQTWTVVEAEAPLPRR